MKTVHIQSARRAFVAFVVLLPLIAASSLSQAILTDLASPSNQADYVIITPASYVDVLRPLAEFRAQHDGFVAVFALTDSIHGQFGAASAPDSTLKAFIMRALTVWRDPKPSFFLLSGNLNAVPSHRVASELSMYEDSVLLDSWYVLADDGDGASIRPLAALGRYPAWDTAQLESMVTKTLVYSTGSNGSWSTRAIAVADSFDVDLFEHLADDWQSHAAHLWPDTLTGHLRSSSPRAWTKDQFIRNLSEGASMVSYWGFASNASLGSVPFYTPEDVLEITPTSPLSLWMLSGFHPFDVPAESSVTLSLLTAMDRGAVAVGVTAGKHFVGQYSSFMNSLADQMALSPETPLGIHLQKTIQLQMTPEQSFAGRLTLLGDPALVIANPIVAGIDPPRGRGLPSRAALHQNYPNPFNPTTTIEYTLPHAGYVTLRIFNVLGEEVAMLVNGQHDSGTFTATWDASGLPSGVYFYRLAAGSFVQTQKAVLMR